MNCKPGDLAIVVSCRNEPQNIGAIRTIVREADNGYFPAWEVDPLLPSGDDCICDTCVRPIKPLGGEDDAQRELHAPRPQLEHMR